MMMMMMTIMTLMMMMMMMINVRMIMMMIPEVAPQTVLHCLHHRPPLLPPVGFCTSTVGGRPRLGEESTLYNVQYTVYSAVYSVQAVAYPGLQVQDLLPGDLRQGQVVVQVLPHRLRLGGQAVLWCGGLHSIQV